MRRIPPAAWIVPAAIVVLGGAAFFLLGGAGEGGGILSTGPDNSIPAFEFRLTKAVPVSTTDTKAKEMTGQTKQVAAEVSRTMTELYTEAFLDPSNWRDGTYDNVWPLFDGGAATVARADVEVLTVGTTAGSGYDTIDPRSGKLIVKVLYDKDDRPATALAIVKFTATAAGKDGTFTAIVGSGQYFLRRTGSGWAIYSYEVDRGDHPTTPKPGPSPSPTAVAS